LAACSLVLVDQTSEDPAALDPADRQADHVCASDKNSKVQRPVWPAPVVAALPSLTVPKTLSTSRHLRVFMEDAAEAITPTDFELI
jgi:hypothetical protein